jgi:hypothetical protein
VSTALDASKTPTEELPPTTPPPTWTKGDMTLGAYLSGAAYIRQDKTRREDMWQCRATQIDTWESVPTDTFAMHIVQQLPEGEEGGGSGRRWVIFRGTSSIRDWLLDLDFRPEEHQSGANGWRYHTHKGFGKAWDSIRGELLATLKSHPGHSTEQVTFCGHSLGGALAVLAAYEYVMLTGGRARVLTFGGPRVGERDYCEEFDREFSARMPKALRVRHDMDVVTEVPPAPPYAHVGHLLHLTRYGAEVGPITRGWRAIWWQILRVLGKARYLLEGRPLDDHEIVRYRQAVAALPPNWQI